MFRCHFTRSGRIAMGENLDSTTLSEAIASGEKMLTERADTDDYDGIEIWRCAALLYASTIDQTARTATGAWRLTPRLSGLRHVGAAQDSQAQERRPVWGPSGA
jgi:hypothetical protein